MLHLPGSPARVLVGSTEDVQGEAHERAQELVEVDPSVVRRCGLLLLMDKRVKESDAKEGRPKRQRDRKPKRVARRPAERKRSRAALMAAVNQCRRGEG